MLSISNCIPGWRWFLWLPVLFLADQWTKFWALREFTLGQSVACLPGLNFHLAYNHGVAFSLFSEQASLGKLLLLVFISLICLGVAYVLARTPRHDKLSAVALTLVLGGALGNVFDRIYHGYVIDFIDFYIHTWHWYTFNIADCFITIGALLLMKKAMFSSEGKNDSN